MVELIPFFKQQTDAFLFTQFGFWLFFGFVLGIHAIVYKKRWLRSGFLYLASLFFYYKTGGYFFTLLVFSTLIDYSIGIAMGHAEKKWYRRLLLILSLFINLGLLAYFKYAYFVSDSLNAMTGSHFFVKDYLADLFNYLFALDINSAKIILPVGISFFTFQTISYSVDVYRKEIKPVTSLVDFGFYVSFFPQLIAGPIVRAKSFIPQIYKSFVLSDRWFWQAVLFILGGLFKKMIISDYVAINLVDPIFLNPMGHSGFESLMAIYGYALQIYCDFSGYTDIALGVALLLGFHLPVNFNYPYKATSLIDFWRRWHISLSTWLRDYLYIPLGGSRKGSFRTYLNLLITMILGGIWHGAALNFILWGLLHGLGLILNRMFVSMFKPQKSPMLTFFGWFLTFHFVVFTWLVFRLDTIESTQMILYRLSSIFNFKQIVDILALHPYLYFLLLIGFVLHLLPTNWHRRGKCSFMKWPWFGKYVCVLLFVVCLVLLHDTSIQPFIYFRF